MAPILVSPASETQVNAAPLPAKELIIKETWSVAATLLCISGVIIYSFYTIYRLLLAWGKHSFFAQGHLQTDQLVFHVVLIGLLALVSVGIVRQYYHRCSAILNDMIRVWSVRFPSDEVVHEWRLTGFGKKTQARTLRVMLLDGKPNIGTAHTGNFQIKDAWPSCRILANERDVSRAPHNFHGWKGIKSFFHSSREWRSATASHTERLGRSLELVTALHEPAKANKYGSWILRIELIGDPEPPDEICVRPVA